MKVLFANKFLFRKGGAEAVMLMERELLHQANVEVIDFSMQDSRNLSSAHEEFFVASRTYQGGDGGPLGRIRTALQLVHSPEAVRQIGRLIDHTKPDLVHCHNVYHQLTPSIIGAAKRRGVPVVLTLHDYKPVCPVYTRLRHGQPCSECLDQSFFNVLRHRCAGGSLSRSALLYAETLVQRWLRSYERLDAVIAPSEFMRASVTRARFPRDRVHVIYNALNTGSMKPASDDRGYALYLGRLSAEKGIETLLAAHAGLAQRLPLWVAGTGPLEQELRARYARARFLGHLTGRALEDAIRGAAVVVVPSEWYENCPISILEAMAYGKTVVASDIGGIPELVVHGETGLLFPAGDRDALTDCLTRLVGNPELRRRYGAAARVRAEQRFSVERHRSALLRLYLTVLESREGRQADRNAPCASTLQE